MKKSIYDLELFENATIEFNHGQKTTECNCRRVPGGWIFTDSVTVVNDKGNELISMTSTFVPLNKEFLEKENKPSNFGGSKVI